MSNVKASRRSAIASSGVAPSPTAPTPGLSWADAPDAVLILFQGVGQVNDAAHAFDSRRYPRSRRRRTVSVQAGARGRSGRSAGSTRMIADVVPQPESVPPIA